MNNKEVRGFQSETKQILNIMINSLYSNKEIFLRELISNASDAIDKLKFLILSKPELYKYDNNNFCIMVSFNKIDRSIIIDDNGIGMSYDEVINNLGTIAKSGTKEFIKLKEFENKLDNNFIGHFGVGFYSSFIVASKVVVHTKSFNDNNGVLWESDGKDKYTINYLDKSSHGTKVILYLKDSEEEFLDYWRLKNIINKYSDHIQLPIKLQHYSNKGNNIWKQINQAKAIWTRNKLEIKDNEYIEFYKHITGDNNDPLYWQHSFIEGKQEYTILLYIPSKLTYNPWQHEQKNGLKLYVRRIFIMDNVSSFLPNYLRFIRGIIDSNDLPLNVSREILQENEIINKIKNSITKKVLSMLEKLAKNDENKYKIFWKQFRLIFKEGLAEDFKNKKLLSSLLRFSHTNGKDQNDYISLDTYVSFMKQEQSKIYYIIASSYNSAKYSPHIEILEKNNIVVLLLFDTVDEWIINYINDFNGKKLHLVSKEDDLINQYANNENRIHLEDSTESSNIFISRVKHYLGNKVIDVKFTKKLVTSPVALINEDNSITTQMAKLLKNSGQSIPKIKYILLINYKHKIINKISYIKDNDKFNQWIELLFNQALLMESNYLDNPGIFVKIINQLLV
ncbi:MAG: molecular chaperone HtpG [Candidatus Lightella neohaematopini]|nr:molecular chaperone HtpG [Candidatus Lightella neohaematopini]MCV2528932.1 molecular chaperone HtpG [Candidatus Lightella neohaematopini]